jgi:carboxyl-terminal processing protease
MENKKAYQIPVVISFCLIVGIYLGLLLAPETEKSAALSSEKAKKIQDILDILDKRYVDSIDAEVLFEETISDLLHRLDPHSNYISAADVQRSEEEIRGEFKGIGVSFYIIRDTICVTNVLPQSPSLKAGLKSGDKIIRIDNKPVAGKGITNDDVMSKLKGPEGTTVNLKIQRGRKKLNKKVTRGVIFVKSVVAPQIVQEGIGYIKIERFSDQTYNEFVDATQKLKAKGMKKLIIDLRNNGGGILHCATDIADEFLAIGDTILVTKGLHEKQKTYKASRSGNLEHVNVVVLVNAQSASASEILAGALQDNDRGTIVGRRSFGKGLVQEDKRLKDGSILRLTIARYYTPTGRCIQREYNGSYEDYAESFYDRYENGEMYEVDSSVFDDSKRFVTAGGKVVYGGGGIMPDIFVPYDSAGASLYYRELRYSDAFFTYAFDYVQNKRKKWKNSIEFEKNFTVSESMLKSFLAYAERETSIPIHKKDLKRSKSLIIQTIKSEIARQLWTEDGYYRILNNTDKDVLRAIEALN